MAIFDSPTFVIKQNNAAIALPEDLSNYKKRESHLEVSMEKVEK